MQISLSVTFINAVQLSFFFSRIYDSRAANEILQLTWNGNDVWTVVSIVKTQREQHNCVIRITNIIIDLIMGWGAGVLLENSAIIIAKYGTSHTNHQESGGYLSW